MKKFYLLLLALGLLQAMPGKCQDFGQTVFHANSIRTTFWPTGALAPYFWDDENTYLVPFNRLAAPSTIHTAGLWLGVKDGSQVKTAAQSHIFQNSPTRYSGDFSAGALNPATGELYAGEEHRTFYRTWSVKRHDVLRHLADFNDNVYLDAPILSVVGWPGHGNPYFHEVNGFDLPNTPQGAAPFFDRLGDGIYNAFDGDYPLPAAVAPGVIPEQILWVVFNDAVRAPDLKEQPLRVEVQMTAWAFFAEDEPLLNRTIFSSYKIVNRSGKDYEDFYCGIWTDLEIGCHTNDYVGSAPDLNAFFAYNSTPVDESCDGTVGYDNFPPVQAVTLLNQPMTSFMTMKNPPWGTPLPDENMADPGSVEEIYNYLSARWRNGDPLTPAGNGYNPGTSLPPVQFAFPDNPNDPAGWSQFAQNLPAYDERGLGSTHFGSFKNGEVKLFDVAYSTHLDSSLNHVEQVNLVYEEVPRLRQWYAERFANLNLPPFCEDDCVWPGDANRDGIANHLDLVAIALGKDSVGTARQAPLNWSGHPAAGWAQKLPNDLNFKHLDCNGDGVVEPQDFEITKINYGLIHEKYVHADTYPTGNDLFFQPHAKIENDIVEPEDGWYTIRVKKAANLPDLKALAFTVEYDPRFAELTHAIVTPSQLAGCYYFVEQHPSLQPTPTFNWDADFALLNLTPGNDFGEHFLFFLRLTQPTQPLPASSTTFRFKNVRAVLHDGAEISLGGESLKLFFHGYEQQGQPLEPAELVVFPNPSDGVFYVRTNGEELDGYQLFDATGRRLAMEMELRQRDFMMDLRRLAAGVYFLQIRQGGQTQVIKLVMN